MPLFVPGPFDQSTLHTVQTNPTIQYSRLVYLDLVSDLVDYSSYVPLDSAHLDVFSTKLWSIILRACSEIDSQLHMLLNEQKGHKIKQTTIKHYIQKETTWQLAKFELMTQFDRLTYRPFASFVASPPSSPKWWRDYNAVKHDRLDSIRQATFTNAINAVAGVFVILYRQWGEYLFPHRTAMISGSMVAEPYEFLAVTKTPWK